MDRGQAVSKLVWTVLPWPFAWVLGYIAKRALAKSGVLDPFADAVGGWLKVNIAPETIAIAVVLTPCAVIYLAAVIIIWRSPRPPAEAIAHATGMAAGVVTNFLHPKNVGVRQNQQVGVALMAVRGSPEPQADWIWPHDAALYLAYPGRAINPDLDQDLRLTAAAMKVTELAQEGKIRTQGRLRGQVLFNPLPQEFWYKATVQYDQRSGPLFKVANYSNPSPDDVAIVTAYDAFQFDGLDLRRLYPPPVKTPWWRRL